MSAHRTHLPQLDADVFLTDGGLETSLIFDDGIELPEFAAVTLLATEEGRAALVRYFERYLDIAQRDEVGVVLESATWRASSDWAPVLGYSLEELDGFVRAAVEMLLELRARYETPATPVVVSGCIGPRGDGYQPGQMLNVEGARAYHGPQITTMTSAGADLITAITMTSSDEAAGVALAAADSDIPVVISFTVETDGRLPSGESLGDAIEAVDAATDNGPAYYMVNCAHPTHFSSVLDPTAGWTARLKGIRANASKMSHAELDEAPELDAGDPAELAADYLALRAQLPHLAVLGGCCGTNEVHIAAISAAVRSR